MEESKTPAIRFEAVLQIGPAADLVNGFVGHQLFEQGRGRFPGNSLELEEADVEPVGEQPLQILFETGKLGVALPPIDQFRPSIDEELDPLGKRVELAQQSDARRLQ